MGTLTVRENFAFSAALRLPSHIDKKEREDRIDQVVFELGLGECANTKVCTFIKLILLVSWYHLIETIEEFYGSVISRNIICNDNNDY